MKINLPTIITFCRLALTPLGVLFYYLPVSYAHPMAAFVVLLVGLSDFLDGYLARKWGQITAFGAFLDPVADKVAVSTALVVVTGYYHVIFITLCSVVVIGREIVISALREWMAEAGARASVGVKSLGKVKTFIQGMAILILIWCTQSSPLWLYALGCCCLLVAVVLTLWSMLVYLRIAWQGLLGNALNGN